ncbi:probable ATP-dependent RNA helicase DDX60 isoform X2 [Thrips palmi]|nr:probable ATP-dependent RNA helicase DDX60 isoform X2 [Thrips palmi]
MDNGGQSLHIIYLVEKFLMIFLSRGLKFTVIFCEIWNICWEPFPQFSIARAALRLHLMNNQNRFSVLSVRSLWSQEFSVLIEDKKPSFILTTLQLPEFLTASRKSKDNWMQFILSSQSVYCGFLHLDVVNIETVHNTAASLMASVHSHLHNFKGIKGQIETLEKNMPVQKNSLEIDELPVSNMRSSILILAACETLKVNYSKTVIDVVKTVLLSAALLELIPLKMRCFKNLLALPLQVGEILKQFQREMAKILNQVCADSAYIDYRQAGDLWHGKFIQAVFNCVCKVGSINCANDLGNAIASQYEELLSHVNKNIDKEDMHPYPIQHICEIPCSGQNLETVSSIRNEDFVSKLIPTTCKLTEMFTGKLACNKLFYSPSPVGFDFNYVLHENRHWHSRKPLTDAIERIPDNAASNAVIERNRHGQTQRNTLARFNTLYGLSLEGRSSSLTIVTNTSKPDKKQRKQVVQPKSQAKGKLNKKEKIIEANLKRVEEEKLRQIKQRTDSFFTKDFASLISNQNFIAAIENCDTQLRYANEFPEVVLKFLFFKGKACFELWKSECLLKQSNRDLYGAKELFLVIREIFKTVEVNGLSFDDKQTNKLSSWLHELGFSALCSMKGLPDPAKSVKGNFEIGMDHVQFQLVHLKADLTRETGGQPDLRADGFIPDPWQVELFDIIDKKQSAVVIAPTSSGKTYASYYCMEQVIRESDDGVVIYVCPTKALVNQVFATIYARFNKTLPPGKTLLGILTRDFRQNELNCQILTTVPECLEILLLSPRCQTWTRRIKYVIFDEVHCLVAQSGGLSWENCILLNRSPFLALSATISKPENFCGWLQKVEDFKQKQADEFGLNDRCSDSYKVSLILHLERHNHLIKNVMMKDGTISHVHPYSFLSQRASSIPEHISLSPDEALELYVSMKQILKSEDVSNLCLLKYFHELCPSGFLSMQSVRKFSETLRIILSNENKGNIRKVLDSFRPVDFDNVETTHEYIIKNIPVVLNSLKKNGLLPALVFSYNRGLVEALSGEVLEYLRSIYDFAEDKETDVECESDTETKKLNSNKEFRRFRPKRTFRRKLGIMRGPSILSSAGSLRGAGVHDEKLINFIEHRLVKIGYTAMREFPSLLRRGLGKHHGGMNNKERSAVEMLFRSRVLNLVFATGTLALGIHMPCKTVIVAGDSPYLNSLEFQQMSGRAGRRGFDKEGNVIFYGLHKRKMEDLMTGSLPAMVGNFPLSCSLILRLLLLVADTTIEGKVSKEATAESYARAYTLLENGLLYESQEHLKSKMKYYFSFVIQFLMRQNLLGSDGQLHVDAKFITHLHYHEPGNFAFYFLLNSGILEEMCECHNGRVTEESLRNLVTVLNFIFGRIPIPSYPIKRTNSMVILPPLPQQVTDTLKKYNRKVLYTFSHYFKCIASELQEKFGDEKSLPLSGVNCQSEEVLLPETFGEGKVLPTLGRICSHSNVCSVFAGLSGNTDEDVSSSLGDIRHVRDDVNVKIVPTIELDFECNAYVLDFYKHGIAKAICRENGLRGGTDFAMLKDFLLVSKSIFVSLSEILSPNAKLLQAMKQIVATFETNFNKAYLAYQGP